MEPNGMEITSTRHNHLIDPGLHIWGWEVPVYLFLGGLVAGLLVWAALLELKGRKPQGGLLAAPWLALGFLTLGMIALFLDLEHKSHVYRFYLAFQVRSPMSWGSWILLGIYPAALLMGLGSMSEVSRSLLAGLVKPRGLGRMLARLVAWSGHRRRPLLWINLAGGLALGVYTGLLLGTMGARPLWNSTLLGPLFLASGLSTGAAFLLFLRPRKEDHRDLVRWDVMMIGVELALIALLLIDLATGPRAAQAAAQTMLGGSWTGPFWSLVILAGLLVPVVMEGLELRRRVSPSLVPAALVLIGGVSLRFIVVMAGQASSFGVF